MNRVAKRVAQGGHYIPEDTIRRRYYTGIRNLINNYLLIADTALILDNSIAGSAKIIARKHAKDGLKVEESIIWKEIQEVAHAK